MRVASATAIKSCVATIFLCTHTIHRTGAGQDAAPFSTATIARRYHFRVWKEALQHRSIAVSRVARMVLLDSFTHSQTQNKLIFGLGRKRTLFEVSTLL